jgi:Uncharacterised protein conserved in bacteria (DUF2336)
MESTVAMTASAVLLAELDSSPNAMSPERSSRMLRAITTLFQSDAHRLNARQISLFDDILLRLIEQADLSTLVDLAERLAGMGVVPTKSLRQLAFHEDICVAGPILRGSARLMEAELLEIAGRRGQPHLLDISSRQTINMPLCDKLVERGGTAVFSKLIQNLGVKFSETAFAALVAKALTDDDLAEQLIRRSGIPQELRNQLAAKVSDIRMRRLLAVPPATQGKIQAAVALTQAKAELGLSSKDCEIALAKMTELSRKGGLNDRSVNRFAVERDYLSLVAALSFLSGAEIKIIESVLKTAELDGLIAACKAARLNWSTTTMIIQNRPGFSVLAPTELGPAKAMFDALALSVAQRTIRLW